jgi:hypothetical protein
MLLFVARDEVFQEILAVGRVDEQPRVGRVVGSGTAGHEQRECQQADEECPLHRAMLTSRGH